MEINLNRLTSSNPTSEMGMFELAHNKSSNPLRMEG